MSNNTACRLGAMTASRAMVVAFSIMSLWGCANAPARRDLGAEVSVNFAAPNAQPDRRDEGVYVLAEADTIRIKLRRQPLLTVIDELAYRRGFNYRLLSDLTPYQVDIHGDAPAQATGSDGSSPWERTVQREFAHEREALDAMLAQVNKRYLTGKDLKLAYRYVSDGPEFYLHKGDASNAELVCNERADIPPRCDPQQVGFKKFFIRNVHVNDAVDSLKDLFFVRGDGDGKREPPKFNQENIQNAAIAVYAPQNAVVVRSTDPALLDKASQALFALDANYQQVLVETLIFQYDDSTARRIGALLDLKKEGGAAGGPRTEGAGLASQFSSLITNSLPTFFYQLSDTERRATLLAKLAMYDNDGLVRVLAEPRLLLQSGKRASVSLQTVKHVLTTGLNTPGKVEVVPSGIDLKITPTVLGNGRVRLTINIEQSEFVSTSETGVLLTKSENKVETSVIAQDGEMISIGGIHTRRDSKSGSGLPGVRDVPTVGHLFGSQGADTSRSRVEFMIRPTVERVAQRLRVMNGNIEKANLLLDREFKAPAAP